MESDNEYQALADLGEAPTLSKLHIAACTTFIGALYGARECKSLNELRCIKAKKTIKPKFLPPTDNSFQLHCLRTVYQLWIWKNALVPILELPSAVDFGYQVDDEAQTLQPVLMTQPIAAPELLNDHVCSCIEICDDRCICFKHEQPCTVACSCKADDLSNGEYVCTNMYTIVSSMCMQSLSDSEDNSND